MDIIKAVIATIAVTVLLNLVLLWSNNLVFILARKPVTWILLAGAVGLSAMLACGAVGVSHSVASWGSALALLLRLPPKRTSSDDAGLEAAVEDAYTSMGISHGRLKYRLGLCAYVIGCVAGYVLAYGEIAHVGAQGI